MAKAKKKVKPIAKAIEKAKATDKTTAHVDPNESIPLAEAIKPEKTKKRYTTEDYARMPILLKFAFYPAFNTLTPKAEKELPMAGRTKPSHFSIPAIPFTHWNKAFIDYAPDSLKEEYSKTSKEAKAKRKLRKMLEAQLESVVETQTENQDRANAFKQLLETNLDDLAKGIMETTVKKQKASCNRIDYQVKELEQSVALISAEIDESELGGYLKKGLAIYAIWLIANPELITGEISKAFSNVYARRNEKPKK